MSRKFIITGPDQDIGLRGPSSNPVFNQGTIRLAPQGDKRKLQCNLVVDLDDSSSAFVYDPPLDEFLIFTATDLGGKVVAGPEFVQGPIKNSELSNGSRVFEAHNYGFTGVSFPSSLTPLDEEKTFIVKFQVNPEIGEGEKLIVVKAKGEDIWIDENAIVWFP